MLPVFRTQNRQPRRKTNRHKPEIGHIMLLLSYIIWLCFSCCHLCRYRNCFIRSQNGSRLIWFACWKRWEAFTQNLVKTKKKKRYNDKPYMNFIPSPFKLVVICCSWMSWSEGEVWHFKLGSCSLVSLDFSTVLLMKKRKKVCLRIKKCWETDLKYDQTHKTLNFWGLFLIHC